VISRGEDRSSHGADGLLGSASSTQPVELRLRIIGLFPDIHWQKIRTNNPLERIMKEIRRRTRVVGAFPDGQSCLNLAAARLRYIAGTAWSAKCYMNMRPLYQPQVMQTEAVA